MLEDAVCGLRRENKNIGLFEYLSRIILSHSVIYPHSTSKREELWGEKFSYCLPIVLASRTLFSYTTLKRLGGRYLFFNCRLRDISDWFVCNSQFIHGNIALVDVPGNCLTCFWIGELHLVIVGS